MSSVQNQIAHIRQLCCLGMSFKAIMPDLMKTMTRVMDCQSGVFMWFDCNGDIDHIYVDIFLPEVVSLFVSEYERLKTPFGPDLPMMAVKGKPLGNYRVMPKEFYRTDMYNLICRPYDQHFMLDGIIKDSGVALGALMLYREKSHKQFTAGEQARLAQLLPYIQHAILNDETSDILLDSWGGVPQGTILADLSGRICHIEPRAREAIFWTEQKNVPSSGSLLQDMEGKLKSIVAQLCWRLRKINRFENAEAPSIHLAHHSGRLTISATRLPAYESATQDLVCLSLTLRRNKLLTIMSHLEALPLSPKQKELSLLLGMGLEPRDIAKKLNISLNTYKEYVQAIYAKLHIHRKEDFYAILTH